MQDANQVLMGATQSSFKTADPVAGNIAAGLAVVLGSDGTVSTTLANGALLGISLGKDLSGTDAFTPVARQGSRVPILLQSNGVNPVIGAQVMLHATSGKADTSGTAVNATYVSGELDAVLEDGSIVTDGCALIDFPGGL
jgi:hypothetical protein